MTDQTPRRRLRGAEYLHSVRSPLSAPTDCGTLTNRAEVKNMAYRNKTYVIFDGDRDIWAYGWMKGWKALPTVDFDFYDAHDLGSELTDRACESTIKSRLRNRFTSAKQVIVLIGENTRYLYRFVRWELDVAVELELPIVAVNLDGKRFMDIDRCPPIIRSEYVVHVPFKRATSSTRSTTLHANTTHGSLGRLGRGITPRAYMNLWASMFLHHRR